MLLWDPAVTDPAWLAALRWGAAAAVYLVAGLGPIFILGRSKGRRRGRGRGGN